MPDDITQERMRELFDYDPNSGVLTWRERPLSRFKTEHDRNVWNTRYAGKVAGGKTGHGYIGIRIYKQHWLAHRLIFLRQYGYLPIEIDHVNGAMDDNRIANLRAADRLINLRNRKLPSDNSSGRIGVNWYEPRRKWMAKICVNYRQIYLGYFEHFNDACDARAAAERKYGFHPNHGRQ